MSPTLTDAELESALAEVEPQIEARDDDTVTYRLIEPVRLGDTDYERVTLRRPKARDFERAESANKVSMMLNLISSLGNIPRKVVEQFDQEDMANCGLLIGNFPSRSRRTGKT